MIEIPTVKRVGARTLKLVHAYDNKNTARKRMKSYRDKGVRVFDVETRIANKRLILIYADV